MPRTPLFLGECNLFTLTSNSNPLYFCECQYKNSFVFSTEEKECEVCLTITIRAALDGSGMIMAL